jgi:DNA-binding NarL/FixJ family response regulator
MEALIQALNTLPVSAVVVDASGTIVAANDTWKEFGRRNGLRIPNCGIGASYLKYSEGKGLCSARFVRDLKDLLAGRLDLLTTIYPCHSPIQKRWFLLVGLPFPLDKPTGAALLHVNLTTMLKLPGGLGRKHEAAAGSQGNRSEQAQLEAISDAIERSVSETLSAQIMAMLGGSTSSRQQLELAASDQTIGRSDAPAEFGRDRSDQAVLDSIQALPHQDKLEDADLNEIIARAGLSKRQVEVLRLLGKGMTNRQIAEALFRSPHTVKLHVSAILERLNLKSRTQAALLASRL